MSGDYLWDGSGPRDPDVVSLERLLKPFLPPAPPPLRAAAPAEVARVTPRAVLMMAASVAAVIALVALVWVSRGGVTVPVMVARLEGAPLVGGQVLTARQTALPAGVTVETDAHARARVDVGTVGQIELEPGSQLDLQWARRGDYRLRLQRGTLRAIVRAQPGQFAIDTPASSSTIVDLGCVFTLTVDAAGDGQVRVVSGWVGVEGLGREAFVPAGAVCPMRPGAGPGMTRYADASAPLLEALDMLERGARPETDAAVDQVLAEARARDAVTLWHLLARIEPQQRDKVFDRLATFVPVPADVTREGICLGRTDMLDRWRASLGSDTDAWWEGWKARRSGKGSAGP